ncbi:hypothetical protein F5887DRAFT_657921 [Amanita rubescens]|nr:hypothetical protein F5887DRAFT_657921 [Amanita rubescens]
MPTPGLIPRAWFFIASTAGKFGLGLDWMNPDTNVAPGRLASVFLYIRPTYNHIDLSLLEVPLGSPMISSPPTSSNPTMPPRRITRSGKSPSMSLKLVLRCLDDIPVSMSNNSGSPRAAELVENGHGQLLADNVLRVLRPSTQPRSRAHRV